MRPTRTPVARQSVVMRSMGDAAHVSPASGVSLGYCGHGAKEYCIAIVEIVNLDIKKHGQIWVVADENQLQVRFLLECNQPLEAYDTEKMHDQLEILNRF